MINAMDTQFCTETKSVGYKLKSNTEWSLKSYANDAYVIKELDINKCNEYKYAALNSKGERTKTFANYGCFKIADFEHQERFAPDFLNQLCQKLWTKDLKGLIWIDCNNVKFVPDGWYFGQAEGVDINDETLSSVSLSVGKCTSIR